MLSTRFPFHFLNSPCLFFHFQNVIQNAKKMHHVKEYQQATFSASVMMVLLTRETNVQVRYFFPLHTKYLFCQET